MKNNKIGTNEINEANNDALLETSGKLLGFKNVCTDGLHPPM